MYKNGETQTAGKSDQHNDEFVEKINWQEFQRL